MSERTEQIKVTEYNTVEQNIQHRVEQNMAERNRIEKNKTEENRREHNRTEQNKKNRIEQYKTTAVIIYAHYADINSASVYIALPSIQKNLT